MDDDSDDSDFMKDEEGRMVIVDSEEEQQRPAEPDIDSEELEGMLMFVVLGLTQEEFNFDGMHDVEEVEAIKRATGLHGVDHIGTNSGDRHSNNKFVSKDTSAVKDNG